MRAASRWFGPAPHESFGRFRTTQDGGEWWRTTSIDYYDEDGTQKADTVTLEREDDVTQPATYTIQMSASGTGAKSQLGVM